MHLTLKHRFFVLIICTIIACASMFFVQSWMSSSSDASWNKLQQQAQARQTLLLQIRQQVGYGALIHNFKNYVLRGTPKYYSRVVSNYDAISALINQYRSVPVLNSIETSALNDIAMTLKQYRQAADQVQGLFARNTTIKEVDNTVKISDSPAIKGFTTLEEQYQLIISKTTNEFEAVQENSTLYMLIVILLALCGGLILVFWLNRFIVERLSELHQAIHGLATGETNLNKRLDVKGNDEFAKLAAELNTFMSHMVTLIEDIRGVSNDLEDGLSHINHNAQGNAARTDQQKNETELLATAVEELANTAHVVADNTSDAVTAVEHAQTEFTNGVQALSSSASSMQKLASEVEQGSNVITKLKSQSDRIGEIISVIGDIAEQTNLLALNAAIEAARAGDQGRGFAVVADEVRTLAGRTQQSTIEIRKMIEELQTGSEEAVSVMSSSKERSNESVSLISEAENALKVIADEMETISRLNLQIAEASTQQSAVTSETSENIQRIFNLSEDTSSAVKENQHAISSLENKSEVLNGLVSRFNL
ncbi:methyl-accepting chemotaxis protein [Neptunomonas japonica]|uniref:Methyl-accepting chemotaxis protein n=1 Tax=Neptunomonas japonica JAMM 1380 TaxID=1441457 RepID=A0A7R6PX16_9GAMM|nr:methyl-accepting chemotaxis protein [Neptunomonas japonica]BBB31123.1 methyl-accepting chemotaxis protein [Neptunomonas japonica JAMM 1380]